MAAAADSLKHRTAFFLGGAAVFFAYVAGDTFIFGVRREGTLGNRAQWPLTQPEIREQRGGNRQIGSLCAVPAIIAQSGQSKPHK